MGQNLTIDPQRQQQMDRYCALSGVSKEKATNELWEIWEKQIYIPWLIEFEHKAQQRDAECWFDEMRARAERGETPDLTMEEIIEEIKHIRAEGSAKR